MAAIMTGTRFDTKKFRRADGDATPAIQLGAPLPEYGNRLMIYVNGSMAASKFTKGMNVAYEGGGIKVSGQILEMSDVGSYYIIFIPSDPSITSNISGGVVYPSSGSSLSAASMLPASVSNALTKIKPYTPYILLGLAVAGGLLYWKFKKKK